MLVELVKTRANLFTTQQALIEITASYQELVEKDQTRFDNLLNDKLGMNQHVTNQQSPEPIKKRKSWGEIRSNYETKKRQEFWAQKIAEVEAQDKARENVSTDGTTDTATDGS